MRSRVYETFLCPSVCLSHLSAAATACGGFAAVGPADRRYRSIATRRVCNRRGRISIRIYTAVGRPAANASSVVFLAAVEGWTQTCYLLVLFHKPRAISCQSFTVTKFVNLIPFPTYHELFPKICRGHLTLNTPDSDVIYHAYTSTHDDQSRHHI